jgi:hypothetical protein
MTDTLSTGKSERAGDPCDFRNGYDRHSLMTRVGQIESGVPRGRVGLDLTIYDEYLGGCPGQPGASGDEAALGVLSIEVIAQWRSS